MLKTGIEVTAGCAFFSIRVKFTLTETGGFRAGGGYEQSLCGLQHCSLHRFGHAAIAMHVKINHPCSLG